MTAGYTASMYTACCAYTAAACSSAQINLVTDTAIAAVSVFVRRAVLRSGT